MTSILLVLALSALPCGLTAEQLGVPCASDAGVPAGVQCWEQNFSGNGRWMTWSDETKWVDPATCTCGSLMEAGGGGSPLSSIGLADLPDGLQRAPALQARLNAAILQPAHDPKNPAQALARISDQLPRTQRGRVALMPALEWWPGAIPQPVDSVSVSTVPPESGTCPCFTRFSGSRFHILREWNVGTQTVSLWGNGARNQALAVAVTDAASKRHRWIHRHAAFGNQLDGHVEGTRWFLPVGDLEGEQSFVLGYDAKTGKAWRVKLGEFFLGSVSDAGVQLQTQDAFIVQPWSSLGP